MSEDTVDENENTEDLEKEPDVYYKPVIELKPVKVVTHEEDEEEMFRVRCKLYRYAYDSDDAEWKERGIGDIKLLKHCSHGRIRVVMRREKVLTVCCNHYLERDMQLSNAQGATSDRALVWSTLNDFADGEPKRETFAARFQSAEIANGFRKKWCEMKKSMMPADDEGSKTVEKADNNKSCPSDDSKAEDEKTANGGEANGSKGKEDGSSLTITDAMSKIKLNVENSSVVTSSEVKNE